MDMNRSAVASIARKSEVTEMLASPKAHAVRPGEGPLADLGSVQMRLLAGGADTDGSFSLTEFSGSAGPWTVPHVHRAMQESFYIVDGQFTFMIGDETVEAGPGSYVLVPPHVRHVIHAGEGGGRLLTLMVPGGLEDMFFELAQLPPGGLTDPFVRAEISARHDSHPA
jgi:quercetin dioxygenase-like cupin family protein